MSVIPVYMYNMNFRIVLGMNKCIKLNHKLFKKHIIEFIVNKFTGL